MANVNAELLGQLSAMIAEALQASIGNAVQQVNAGAQNQANDAAAPTPKIPTFSMSEYRPSDGSSVADYFSRFKWALELSQIPQIQYANYARVHMGVELNNALKFLVSPQDPATIDFEVLQTTLVNHFDRKKNKYVESIKFRQIVQQTGESVAQFVLRLRQGAADCEYEDFLDRMLIEQLLHGLEAREMCDEIIAKKPATSKEAYEIAYTLEATRNTAREVNTGATSSAPEETNRLGYESLRTRRKSTFNHPKNVHGEQRTNIQPDNEVLVVRIVVFADVLKTKKKAVRE
ncbi:AAEL005818-PA [Aedes aegypti]|uniref:AAEL005818-PA n=1 Tax=Aedes aegypti TaxID=7159 RepID=Q178R0_AEDAE|nr:AAEL005818-PA [Aedes aegypti]